MWEKVIARRNGNELIDGKIVHKLLPLEIFDNVRIELH